MTTTATRATWSEYRKRARLFWAVLLLGPIFALALASAFLVERLGIHGVVWPLLLWALAALAVAMYWQGFVCPRCKHRFFRNSPPVLALLARRCVNCMMPKDH
ncbi:MAG: hypothetical protein EOP39_22585 [Rubrivivax sp.]|nr:MAG: hypothetical protein EOP39_22585 [Rubrivivax sp.]